MNIPIVRCAICGTETVYEIQVVAKCNTTMHSGCTREEVNRIEREHPTSKVHVTGSYCPVDRVMYKVDIL